MLARKSYYQYLEYNIYKREDPCSYRLLDLSPSQLHIKHPISHLCSGSVCRIPQQPEAWLLMPRTRTRPVCQGSSAALLQALCCPVPILHAMEAKDASALHTSTRMFAHKYRSIPRVVRIQRSYKCKPHLGMPRDSRTTRGSVFSERSGAGRQTFAATRSSWNPRWLQ